MALPPSEILVRCSIKMNIRFKIGVLKSHPFMMDKIHQTKENDVVACY